MGLTSAKRPSPPRRIQRSEKLWAFQVKKPTGRTALRLRRLPSTRQKIPAGEASGGRVIFGANFKFRCPVLSLSGDNAYCLSRSKGVEFTIAGKHETSNPHGSQM